MDNLSQPQYSNTLQQAATHHLELVTKLLTYTLLIHICENAL